MCVIFCQLPVLEEKDPCLSPEAVQLAVKLIERFDALEEKEQGYGTGGLVVLTCTIHCFNIHSLYSSSVLCCTFDEKAIALSVCPLVCPKKLNGGYYFAIS